MTFEFESISFKKKKSSTPSKDTSLGTALCVRLIKNELKEKRKAGPILGVH